jgi:cellulose synthase/poly-beta-1,6-N-acetylglucosamine synthase-like glycosyltransferase
LKKKYPNFEIINNKKRIGKAKILNKVIQNTDTDYIFVSDANIFLEKNALKFLINTAEKGGFKIVYGNLKLKKSKYSSITDEEIKYWNRENFIKILEYPYNITSPVGGFYIIKNENVPKIPKKCLIEDMYILIKTLQNKGKISFEKKALGYEYTTNSTLSEFSRKKRIIKGGFFITYIYFKEKIFLNLSFKDNFAIITNKILRWFYPIIYFLTLFSGILSYKKSSIARFFVKLNFYSVLSVFLEFSVNSLKNYITGVKRTRVNFLKKPLYFFMLIFAGISALFNNEKNPLWKKELR